MAADHENGAVREWRSRAVWIAALAASVLVAIPAAFRGGYIGPDYWTHFRRLTDWSQVFDLAASNPPGYYLIGYGLFHLIGSSNAFPITLSILQAAINAVALGFFLLYSERRFSSRLVHLGFAIFLTFLPVRVIHVTAISADATTIPLFVLILFLFEKLRCAPTSTLRDAVVLGLGLAIAIFIKYSFMALIPAVLVLLVFMAWNRRWKLSRFVAIAALALTLPSAVAAGSFWASSRLHGYNTEKHWAKGVPPDMDFQDLFFLSRADMQLFRAPELSKHHILFPHLHSYLGLSHMGVFTDPMDLFQDLSVPQGFGAVLIPEQKTRKPWKTPVMQVSMAMGTIWTLLALAGTAWTIPIAIRNVRLDKLEREHVAVILGIAYFLLMFLPIPFVHAGARFGYWMPRLILPPLLCFFWAAFLLIDRKIVGERRIVASAIFLLVLIQCAIETVFLV